MIHAVKEIHEAHSAAAQAVHAADHGSGGAPHAVNWISLLARSLEPSPLGAFIENYEKLFFSLIVGGLIAFFCLHVTRRVSLVPGRSQLILEEIVQGIEGLVTGIAGEAGRKYAPFIGALFVYILASNWFGLIPLQNSATAYLTTTAPLALCVFFYVQWIGLTRNGLRGYLYHLAGSPKDFFGWALVPLNLPLHILGEFAKPVSLAFRLYGNIMAGHILVAVFLGLGLQMLKGLGVPFGLPIQFPFLFLELLVGMIQAFVFSLLSTVYIAMMLPHEEGHGRSEGGQPAPEGPAQAMHA